MAVRPRRFCLELGDEAAMLARGFRHVNSFMTGVHFEVAPILGTIVLRPPGSGFPVQAFGGTALIYIKAGWQMTAMLEGRRRFPGSHQHGLRCPK